MMHAAVTPSPAPAPLSLHDAASVGGRLVSTTGRALPLLGASLTAEAAGGVARVVVEQRFHNPHAEPLVVTYSLPLPADGAVSGFSFRIGERRVVGEVDAKKAARERYEQALVEGRSAAILEQDRSSLFTQEIGNIPPGEEIIAEIVIDQRLRWLDEGAWEWRFPTVVEARYLGAAGRVPDAARVTQDVAEAPLPARFSLACSIRDAITEGKRPESPSHAITAFEAGGALRIELGARLGARLDRDVVVRWPVASPRVGLTLDAGRAAATHARGDTAYGLLTVVPPALESAPAAVPRDLIVLLDTSGSMGGEPLAQAQRMTTALIATLRATDQLELIEFSSSARRWKRGAVAADERARREATAWVNALQASGSTEMREGILAAMSAIREGSQRQIVLITDGMIGFEAEVVAAIAGRLPASSRLHTVGVGSAVNRSLTGPAARAGHGLEVVIGIGEDPAPAVARLLARTTAPLLVELELRGSALIDHAPLKLPDLFAGAPALISVALRAEGGELSVHGRTAEGTWEQRLHVAAIDAGTGNQATVALFGREAVEDLETHLAGGGDKREIDATIERLGLDFQIATRLTSWVAISRDATVDPRDPLRRERMPQELPYGVSAEGIGLRAVAASAAPMGGVSRARAMSYSPAPAAAPMQPPPPVAQTRPVQNPKTGEEIWLGSAASSGASSPNEGRVFSPRRLILDVREESAKQESANVAPQPRLRGRVLVHAAGSLVIEVIAEGGALDWILGATAQIELADGTLVEAAIDGAKTTRAGLVAAGQSARLGLTPSTGATLLDLDLDLDPKRIHLTLNGVTVIVEL